MTEFQKNLNAILIHNSNTDLDSNIIAIHVLIYYINLGSNSNINTCVMIFMVIVILNCIVINPMPDCKYVNNEFTFSFPVNDNNNSTSHSGVFQIRYFNTRKKRCRLKGTTILFTISNVENCTSSSLCKLC